MINALKRLADTLLPLSAQLPARYVWNKCTGNIDPEMVFVQTLLRSRRRFLDVGANAGIYSYLFSSSFSAVEAFEPIAEITGRLAAVARLNIRVHNVALSNAAGQLSFYIPTRDGKLVPPLASLELKEPPFEHRVVDVQTIDHFGFDDVDLMKIDVEGHEAKVIEGARKTIERSQPILIVEIEQRHLSVPMQNVINFIEQLGYQGYFLEGNVLKESSAFAYSRNQAPYLRDVADRRYVNNFIFCPRNASVIR